MFWIGTLDLLSSLWEGENLLLPFLARTGLWRGLPVGGLSSSFLRGRGEERGVDLAKDAGEGGEGGEGGSGSSESGYSFLETTGERLGLLRAQ